MRKKKTASAARRAGVKSRGQSSSTTPKQGRRSAQSVALQASVEHQPVGPVTAVGAPAFAEPVYSSDATEFVSKSTDTQYLSQLGATTPLPIPAPMRSDLSPEDLALTLQTILGPVGPQRTADITAAKRVVFHAVGDTGPIHSPGTLNQVVDRMVADFKGEKSSDVPSFCYHLGDVVYYFGESEFYYDQFYEPFHAYPAPIVAIPGNHDGIVYSGDPESSLAAFIRNFCAPAWQKTPESGALSRTAMIQPSVYFRMDSPLVTIIGLYSNVLENFGVISDKANAAWKIGQAQLAFLSANLAKLAREDYQGAIIIAMHHPPFTSNANKASSPEMLREIDEICQAQNIWPHAVLSGHAHNYQRFTRVDGGRETPYVVCGCSGHNPLQAFKTTKVGTALRTPATQSHPEFGQIRLENRLEKYGYLRIVVTPTVLSIEFYDIDPSSTGKSPVDVVNVNLTTRKLVAQRP